MCDCDYSDPPTFYESKMVRGRKTHRCCECLRTIEKGEQHQYTTGLWDGNFEDFRTCDTCLAMIAEVKLECYCHGFVMDELDVRDYEGVACVESFFARRRANWDLLYGKTKETSCLTNGTS